MHSRLTTRKRTIYDALLMLVVRNRCSIIGSDIFLITKFVNEDSYTKNRLRTLFSTISMIFLEKPSWFCMPFSHVNPTACPQSILTYAYYNVPSLSSPSPSLVSSALPHPFVERLRSSFNYRRHCRS